MKTDIDFHKVKYQREVDSYRKPAQQRKIYVLGKNKGERCEQYGIVIPRKIVYQYNLQGVYYNLNVEGSGARLILESGCKIDEPIF